MEINDHSETSGSDSSSSSMEEPEAQLSDVEAARAYLAQRGIEVDTNDSSGLTPLMTAAWEGHCDIVKNLLQAGVPVNCVNAATGDNALILAASRGHLEIVDLLLGVPGIDLAQANSNGDTVLMVAASKNQSEVTRRLLSHDADVNLVNEKHGYTALLLAADYGLAEIVEILLTDPSIHLNTRNPNGDTALILASAAGCREIVQRLLRAGADTSPVDDKGYCALGAATVEEDAAIVELLLDQGAELDDFDACSRLEKGHSAAVTDLFAKGNCFRPPSGSMSSLTFVRNMSRSIPVGGASRGLLQWLQSQGLLMACAQELAIRLAPAPAWALKGHTGVRVSKDEQQLIYCLSALSRLESSGAAENVTKVYRQAGVSEEGVDRLGGYAAQQLRHLQELAMNAAAQLGSELIDLLLNRCLDQTSLKYEVRAVELEERLVQAGFIEPVARITVSAWQAVLSKMQEQAIVIPSGLSFVETMDFVQGFVVQSAQSMLPVALKENLRGRSLVRSLEAILISNPEEVIHLLFQIQCDWISQFCEQALES
jgi:ankyrin repeat protein